MVVEGGVKGFGIGLSSDIAVSSLSLGAWIDFERSSRVFLDAGVVTSAATRGGAELGVASLPGVLVSLGVGCELGLGLGVGVDGKDSVSMESPSSVRTFGGKYCEPERCGLGSGWRIPIGDGCVLTLAALTEDWSFISASEEVGVISFVDGCIYIVFGGVFVFIFSGVVRYWQAVCR